MVFSRQVEIPFYRGIGRQRGQGFGALAQVIGRTAFLFLRKYIVPAAKRVGSDLLEFAAPEIADVATGGKNFQTAAKSVGENNWVVVAEKKCKQSHSNKICKTIQSVARRHFKKLFSLTVAIVFWYKILWQFLEILEENSQSWTVLLMSHEQKTYPTTSLNEN